MQQTSLPFQTAEKVVEVAERILQQFPVNAYPHLTEMAVQHVPRPGDDDADGFECGLDLILDGLERGRDTA